MEHPLIGDLDGLNLEELQTKIQDLNRRLRYAQRINNAYLVAQINLALNSYTATYKKKQQDLFDRQSNTGSPDFSDRIDIS